MCPSCVSLTCTIVAHTYVCGGVAFFGEDVRPRGTESTAGTRTALALAGRRGVCSASSCRRGCVSLWPLAVSMGSMHEHMRPTLSLLALFFLRARAPCAANYAHCYDSECCASDPDVAPALAVPRLSCPFSLLSADVRCPVWLVSLCARPVRLLQARGPLLCHLPTRATHGLCPV